MRTVLLGLWTAACCSCRLDSSWTPETQVVIDVDAERAVRERTASLEVVIAGSTERETLLDAEPSLDERIPIEGGERWPLRFVTKPRDGDAERLFVVSATARDQDGAFVARVRAASGYVRGEVRQLHLQLTAACVDVTCEGLETCAEGACVDAWQSARSLPVLQEAPDAGASVETIDAGGDASTPGTDEDAGSDVVADGGLITGTPTEDPCTLNNGGCDELVICQMRLGVVICGACPSGYDDVQGDGRQCRDRDECQENNGGCDPKFASCTNTPGGHDCQCNEGYHGDGKRCSKNVPCEDHASCDSHASCDAVEGLKVCVCKKGFEGNGVSCVDVDECARQLDTCRANSVCVNKSGTFECPCLPGYLDESNTCTDRNECSTPENNCDDQPAACVNDPGTFHCACPAGYSGDGKGAMGCADVDECATNKDNCSAMPEACVNDVGGFHCACPAGYSGDGVGEAGCKDVDECAAGSDGCDDMPDACVNDVGGFHCQCPRGYLGDGKAAMGCTYNDECMLGTDDCDRMPNACVDDLDGFHCTCPPGYSGNGRGENGCVDSDECAMRSSDCDTSPNACVNTVGGFRCDCPSGYSGNGRGNNGCVDIDECENRSDGCDQSPRACVNDPGGFHCQCPSGYMGSGQGDSGCVDVNECEAQSDDCDGSPDACVNESPGFQCRCPPGYAGDGRGSGGCDDVDECSRDNGGCDALRACVNSPGGFRCGACREGYGTAGPTGCSVCTCYQQGGDRACSSTSASLPAAAARDLPTGVQQNASTLFGFQTVLPANSRVTGFGAFKKPGGAPGFRMGLYRDDGGKPGARVSRTARVTFSDASLTLPAQNDSGVCLPGGAYWVIALSDDAITLGQDGGQGAVATVSLGVEATVRDLPDSWPGGGGVNSAAPLSMYVTVDHP